MSTLRIIREITMFVAVVSGTAIGYAAGQSFGSTAQFVCAFLGMGVFGAFADFCMRGGNN